MHELTLKEYCIFSWLQYYIKKEDGGNISDGKGSSKSIGTTDNENVGSTQKGCETLNIYEVSQCTRQP